MASRCACRPTAIRFLVDWDADGDLDLLSGSALGGAFLFVNEGTRTEPAFGARIALLEAAGEHAPASDDVTFGTDHIHGPGSSTRVWAADVDGDGKLDLLIGDSVTLNIVAKGVTEAAARSALTDFNKRLDELMNSVNDGTEPSDEEMEAFSSKYEALHEDRAKFVDEQMTGFVWLLRQK